MTALVDTLFITGCGGDIALSIARFVREDGLARRIIGADVRDDHPGFAFYDEVLRLPRADAPDYLDALEQITVEHGADIVVPMSEAELARLLAEGWVENGPLRMLTANRRAIEVGLDKMATFQCLDEAGIAVPRTGILGETEPQLPAIVKMRRGQGSKGLALAESWNLAQLTETRAGDLWQEFLPDADAEYTCGLFRLPEAGVRSLVLRRKLVGGLTGSAVVVHDPAITATLARVAEALDLRGAVNVQLRMHRGKPHIFEINPRFSSTVGFRHRIGFRDFVWSLEDAVGRKVSAQETVAEGTALYRVGTEIVRPAPAGA